jgi:hypothetical protein
VSIGKREANRHPTVAAIDVVGRAGDGENLFDEGEVLAGEDLLTLAEAGLNADGEGGIVEHIPQRERSGAGEDGESTGLTDRQPDIIEAIDGQAEFVGESGTDEPGHAYVE